MNCRALLLTEKGIWFDWLKNFQTLDLFKYEIVPSS